MPILPDPAAPPPDLHRLIELSQGLLAVASLSTGRWLAANAAFTRATGWSDEDLRATDALALLHPPDRASWGQMPGRTIPIRRRDGHYRSVAWRFDRDEAAGLLYCAGSVAEAGAVPPAMAGREEQLQQFGEASADVLWIRYADSFQLDYLSPGFARIFGFTRQDAVRGDNYAAFLELVLEADREIVANNMAAVAAGERRSWEYRIRRPTDGQIRWLVSAAFPMRDANGQLTRIGGIDHDTSSLKRAEEHLAALLSELQHRVRNTLSVIRSIARRTAETSQSVDDYAMHLDGRIQAFARVQAAATRSPAGRVDLELLVRDELRAAVPRTSQVEIGGPEVQLRGKAAETLALALHELTTNAIKHGALAGSQGRISIAWQREGDELVFDWIESGLALPPEPPSRRGFGLELLERTLSYELDAITTLRREATGLSWNIRLPWTTRLVDD